VRFAVEAWAPDYGAPSTDDTLAESTADVDPWVEVSSDDDWRPMRPSTSRAPFTSLLFVDGVRRVEANVWITDDAGAVHQAICASYGSGAVLCDGTARVVQADVRRGLFSVADRGVAIASRHGVFDFHRASAGDTQTLSLKLQQTMARLEVDVASASLARFAPEVVVVDGPLRETPNDPERIAGYIKTHARSYGPPMIQETVTALGVRERTPLFGIGGVRPKLSCYLRLPVDINHGWAGVVRLEAVADQPVADAIGLLDRLSSALPRFASVPHKDPRAPQNLSPIGGLERELRRRLGDPALIYRALLLASRAAPDQD
jgi:hypothetical protein